MEFPTIGADGEGSRAGAPHSPRSMWSVHGGLFASYDSRASGWHRGWRALG
jgi:hypothetical protein